MHKCCAQKKNSLLILIQTYLPEFTVDEAGPAE